MTVSKILIIGSRGAVGSAIAAAAGERACTAARAPGAASFTFDAGADDVRPLLDVAKPRAVVLAFGISGTHACASRPLETRFLNVDRVTSIAKAAADHGVLPVVLSSDAVFNGTPTVWTENDKPDPICEYGRQKRDAEAAIATLGVPYLLLRLSRVVADHANCRDLLYQWCASIADRKLILLPEDQSFRPIAAGDLGHIVVNLIDAQARGLFHVAGPEQVSSPQLFDLLLTTLRNLEVNAAPKIERCRVADLPGLQLRPASTLLDIARLERELNPSFTPLGQSIEAVAVRAFNVTSRPIKVAVR